LKYSAFLEENKQVRHVKNKM